MRFNLSLDTFKNIPIGVEVLAGLTVAMTMIPESISFAILAGLPPLTGLYAAFIMGLVTAILGGRPGMVSGGAGATVITLIALASTHGVSYLFAAVILAGVIQFLIGAFKWGKFVRLIPQPVMYGFLNGLALVIFMAQVQQFKAPSTSMSWLSGWALYTMIGLTALTIALVLVLPKLTKAIPASLLAIGVVFGLVAFLGIDTKKVVDIATVSGSLPTFSIPQVPFSWQTLEIIFPYALIMATVGLIESLLTLNMVDEITSSKGNANTESIAQGTANICSGFFGAMGGCAMVAQTLVNLNAGGRTRLSALIGALAILAVILIAGPVIEQIPMAALVGVMMLVAVKTFQWFSLRIITKFPKSDIFVGVLVAVITVLLHNLALAVLVGVVISALVFAWQSAKAIGVTSHIDPSGIKCYVVNGPLFFGSTTGFLDAFNPQDDPQEILVDFKNSRVVDMSAIGALDTLSQRYDKLGKRVIIRHVSADCRALLSQAQSVIQVRIQDDPTYKVMP